MDRLELLGSDVLTNEKTVSHHDYVGRYLREIDRIGRFVHGVVVHTDAFAAEMMRKAPHWYEDEKCEWLEEQVVGHDAGFVLVDGNHRTTAALLKDLPLDLYVCRTIGDVTELTNLYYEGKLFSWPHRDYTFRELISRFAHTFLRDRYCSTLDVRLEEMRSRGVLDDLDTAKP